MSVRGIPGNGACSENMKKNECRIYIHIPFCLRKCAYCDFLSFSSDEDLRSRYIYALKNEIKARLAPDLRISSVFFGGGTPTVLPGEKLAGILDEIRNCTVICKDAEITCEANPCTLDDVKLRSMKNAGFNRLSIGAQSMNDENLKILGRLHDKKTFYKAFEAAENAGFDNINIDLISGLPGQTVSEWEQELHEAAVLGSRHISVYSLELYEDTPLYRNRDRYRWPTDDDLALMYERTADILAGYGLLRYEISNYAKPGFESRHNTGYWTGDEYLGLGIGAASYEGRTRYSNTMNFREYLEKMSDCPDPAAIRADLRVLDKKELETEFMILGLRLTRGVSLSEFEARFGESAEEVFGSTIRKYVDTGFMERSKDRIRLSRKAYFVSNSILAEFILPLGN